MNKPWGKKIQKTSFDIISENKRGIMKSVW